MAFRCGEGKYLTDGVYFCSSMKAESETPAEWRSDALFNLE